jgi:hypothetical protein
MFGHMEPDADDELIASIAPDVMKCLVDSGFFDKLDDLLCSDDDSCRHENCRRDYNLSEAVLRASEFDGAARADIFEVLRSKGGFCDCEILYNVVESSRLKTKYWRSRADGRTDPPRHADPHPDLK